MSVTYGLFKVSQAKKVKVRTFSGPGRDYEMLDAIAQYHSNGKSAAISGLTRKEFWSVFPNGTNSIIPDQRAKVSS